MWFILFVLYERFFNQLLARFVVLIQSFQYMTPVKYIYIDDDDDVLLGDEGHGGKCQRPTSQEIL